MRYFGFRFYCPCCNGRHRKLLPGPDGRPNAACPRCGSLERHRLLWLYLQNRTDFFTSNSKVLDIAPMEFFQKKCLSLTNIDYVSIDLSSPLAMIKMDITDMKFKNNYFNCIICYHVLEHIPDDRTAIRELYRVLKPGGWAIIQVPILRKKTFEDFSINSPEERKRVYGQEDHVRSYGFDFKDRLEEAGFEVKIDDYVRRLSARTVRKYRLVKDEDIYFCRKPLTATILGDPASIGTLLYDAANKR